jgi:uncharacterized protein YnzC (UPF0291/DUF896 family)
MTQEKIARFNELTRLSRERALTKEEEEERKLLRQADIEDFKAGARHTLDNTLVQYSDGTCITLEESAKNRDKSADPNGTV